MRLFHLGDFFRRTDSDDLAARAAALAEWAQARGLSVTGGPIYSFYDAPWSLPWNRRNEVAFALN